MSREDMHVVHAAYDAYFRGDVNRLLELVSPDVVVEQPPELADTRRYSGREGLIQAISEWTSEWDDYRLEMVRMLDADGDLLVTVRQRGRGKGSGVEVESVFTFVHSVEGGRVASWRMFTSEEQALAAVGLQE